MRIFKTAEFIAAESNKMRLMLYTLFCLIVADGLLTDFLVSNGYGFEANPFLQTWVTQDLFLYAKILVAFLVTMFLWVKYRYKPRLTFNFTVVSLVFYTCIVYWNSFAFLNAQF